MWDGSGSSMAVAASVRDHHCACTYATVYGELIPSGSLVSVEAACYRGTHIVGGGEHLVDWGAVGGALHVAVATVVSIRPSRCLVTATLTS